MQEGMRLGEQMECVDEDNGHLARFQVAQLVEQV